MWKGVPFPQMPRFLQFYSFFSGWQAEINLRLFGDTTGPHPLLPGTTTTPFSKMGPLLMASLDSLSDSVSDISGFGMHLTGKSVLKPDAALPQGSRFLYSASLLLNHEYVNTTRKIITSLKAAVSKPMFLIPICLRRCYIGTVHSN